MNQGSNYEKSLDASDVEHPNETNERASTYEPKVYHHSEMKEAREHPLVVFFKLLNQDVYSSLNVGSEDINDLSVPNPRSTQFAQEICKLMQNHPLLCTKRYPFKSFYAEQFQHFQKESIHPLHMLCALNAPLSCIKTCYSLYPIAMNEHDSIYGNPLHYTCRFHSDVAVFQYVFKEMKAYHSDSFAILNRHHKRSPLHLACMNSRIPIKVFEFIVMKTPSEVQLLPDKYHMNLLHLACGSSEPRFDVVKTLLLTVFIHEFKVLSRRNDGINIDGECCSCTAQDNDGSTPVHKALRSKANSNLIKLLLFRSQSPLQMMDNNGQLPIHVALQILTTTTSPSDSIVSVLRILIAAYPHGLKVPDMQSHELPQQYAKRLNLSNEIIEMLQPLRSKRVPVEEIVIHHISHGSCA
jgi:hypothetical protein